MPKYIVSGYIGFENFGDEAIASVLVNKLKCEGAEKITLISSNPSRTEEIHKVNSCKMLGFWKDLKEADVLISGGGSLLQDVTSFKSLIYYLGVIYLALIMGKKVEIFAQGIGPINSKFGQTLTKFALKKAQKISVRDKKSQELLLSWGIKSELVQDPVLSLELPQKRNKGTLGVQLRSFHSVTDEFLNLLANEIIKNFSNKKIQIFSFQDSLDLEICRKFEQILIEKGFLNKIEILSKLSVNEVFEYISDLEYMVAMRFHAGVVAVKSGVKTLMINYDIKVEKLAQEFDLPYIGLNQTDFSEAFSKI